MNSKGQAVVSLVTSEGKGLVLRMSQDGTWGSPEIIDDVEPNNEVRSIIHEDGSVDVFYAFYKSFEGSSFKTVTISETGRVTNPVTLFDFQGVFDVSSNSNGDVGIVVVARGSDSSKFKPYVRTRKNSVWSNQFEIGGDFHYTGPQIAISDSGYLTIVAGERANRTSSYISANVVAFQKNNDDWNRTTLTTGTTGATEGEAKYGGSNVLYVLFNGLNRIHSFEYEDNKWITKKGPGGVFVDDGIDFDVLDNGAGIVGFQSNSNSTNNANVSFRK